MSRSSQLRKIHAKMRLNTKSKRQDEQIKTVVQCVKEELEKELNVQLAWESQLSLKSIVSDLRSRFPDVSFTDPVAKSFMRPDGGITYLLDKSGARFPILFGEVKNQGTNDVRIKEGLKKQSKGNAVEGLGKNVIGLRIFMLSESIFPFVCFGDGCDFEEKSSILDRALTISMFGALNEKHIFNEGSNGIFNRGSYYFRAKEWKVEEIFDILYDVAKSSIYYYFSKYGEDRYR